jgi:hypothetical protein
VNSLDNIRRGELKRILLYQGASKIEVHNMVEDIMAERARWTAIALGRRMNLTFALKIKFRIMTKPARSKTAWFSWASRTSSRSSDRRGNLLLRQSRDYEGNHELRICRHHFTRFLESLELLRERMHKGTGTSSG